MTAHTKLDHLEYILRDTQALRDRLQLLCVTLHGPGSREADDAHTKLSEACDLMTDSLFARDDYSDADRQRDLLSAPQDERRGAV